MCIRLLKIWLQKFNIIFNHGLLFVLENSLQIQIHKYQMILEISYQVALKHTQKEIYICLSKSKRLYTLKILIIGKTKK